MSKIFENWNKFVNEGIDTLATQTEDYTELMKKMTYMQRAEFRKAWRRLNERIAEINDLADDIKDIKTRAAKAAEKLAALKPGAKEPIRDKFGRAAPQKKASYEATVSSAPKKIEAIVNEAGRLYVKALKDLNKYPAGPEKETKAKELQTARQRLLSQEQGAAPSAATSGAATSGAAMGGVGGTGAAAAAPTPEEEAAGQSLPDRGKGAQSTDPESGGKSGRKKKRRGYRVISRFKRKGMPATRDELKAFYKEIKEKGLSKTLGKADFVWGRKHAAAFDALQKLKPAAGGADTGEVKYIPNLPAPPKAIRGSSDDSINEQTEEPEIDYTKGTGPLAKLAAEPSGTRTKPAKGSIWGKLNVRQVKQAMANRKRFGLTNTPDEQLAVIVDPEFIDYFGLSIGEASKAYKANASRASLKDVPPAGMPTGKDKSKDEEIEKLKADIAKLQDMIKKGGEKGNPKAERVLKKKLDQGVKKPPVNPAVRRRLIRKRNPMDVDVFRKAQRFYREASWPMDEEDMAAIAKQILADGQAGIFHDLYNVVLKEEDDLDRLDVGMELAKAGLSELAIDFRQAVLNDQAKFVGSGIDDPYGYRRYADQMKETKVTMSVLKTLIKEQMKLDADQKSEPQFKTADAGTEEGIPKRKPGVLNPARDMDPKQPKGEPAKKGVTTMHFTEPDVIDVPKDSITKSPRSLRQAHRALYKARKAAKAAAKAQGKKSWRQLSKSDPARQAFSKAYRTYRKLKKAADVAKNKAYKKSFMKKFDKAYKPMRDTSAGSKTAADVMSTPGSMGPGE